MEKILYKDLAYKVVGCFYEVYNNLGAGFKEVVYHKALALEFEHQKVSYESEKQLSIIYKGKKIGAYVPDFIIDGKIIVEVKAVELVPNIFETQLYNYLKATKYKLGYLVNFGSSKIDIQRRIYDKIRNADSR